MTLGLFATVLVLYWALRDMPDLQTAIAEGNNPSRYTQVLAQNGEPILSYEKYHHKPVALNEISPHVIQALLATEDRRFYQHPGVDPIGLVRAVVVNITHKRYSEGASTITQQLARNLYLTNERSLKRKIQEMALAFQLERSLGKDEILELYLNSIFFGEGAYGIQAASEVYFNKLPSQLSVTEAALLAGMPQAPTRFNPYMNSEGALKRRNEVLDNLVEAGALSAAEAEPLKGEPLRLNRAGRQLAAANRAPFFNQYVVQQVRNLLGLDEQAFWQSGLRVVTTLDLQAQRLATQALMEAPLLKGSSVEGALLSLDPRTGKILAYVGGKDYHQSQFDRVSSALRSPGSLFKVFTYTAALERGIPADRVYVDAPLQVGDWQPKNYDGKHKGYMTLAQALVQSNNVVAVKLLQDVGPDAVIGLARRMGLVAKLNNDLALTLGGSGVTMLDVVPAVGVLANRGVRVEPYAIEKITDRHGRLLYQHYAMENPVLDRTTVDSMVALMQAAVQLGTGRAANIGRPLAGKTGTSDENRDGWFVGFTPTVITGVWMGRDDNQPVPGLIGGVAPAQTWATMMRPYLVNTPPQAFAVTEGVTAYTAETLRKMDLTNLSPTESNGAPAPNASVPSEEEIIDDNAVETLPNGDPVPHGAAKPSVEGLEADPSVTAAPGRNGSSANVVQDIVWSEARSGASRGSGSPPSSPARPVAPPLQWQPRRSSSPQSPSAPISQPAPAAPVPPAG